MPFKNLINIAILERHTVLNPTCDTVNVWGFPICQLAYLKELFNKIYNVDRFSCYTLNDLITFNYNFQILIFSSNLHTWDDVQTAIIKTNCKVLIHLDDETGGFNYEFTSNVKNPPIIFRNSWYNKYNEYQNTFHFHLGYHCWDSKICTILPINKRKYTWSFIGDIGKGDRKPHADVLSNHFSNNYCTYNGNDGKNNAEIYQNSIFVLSPKGNFHFDSQRQYNASRNGCIPIFVISRDDADEACNHLIGEKPPWIFKETIEDLIVEMRILLKDPIKLQQLSNNNLEWWDNHFMEIRNKINNSVQLF